MIFNLNDLKRQWSNTHDRGIKNTLSACWKLNPRGKKKPTEKSQSHDICTITKWIRLWSRRGKHLPFQPASQCLCYTLPAAVTRCCWLYACCGRTDDICSGIKLGLRHRGGHTSTKLVKFCEYDWIILQGIGSLLHLAAGGLVQYSKPYKWIPCNTKPQPVKLRGATSTAPSLLGVDPESFQIPIRIATFLEYS